MPSRPLPYPLYNSAQLEGDAPYGAPPFLSLAEWPTSDSDEEIQVVFKLSLNQYVMLASMIDVGSDIAYPELSVAQWDLWTTRIVAMSICQSVADCITNNGNTQLAIENYLNDQSQIINNINRQLADLQVTSIEAIANDQCDDRRFAGIRSVVSRLNLNCIDMLENLSDDARDIFERVDTAITTIPVVGDAVEATGFDGILQFAQSIAQDALDEYEVQSTQALLDELACDVFCNTSGCSVTIDDFIDAYARLLPQSVQDLVMETIGDLFGYLFTGNLLNDSYFALVNLLQLFTLKVKQEFLGLTSSTFDVEYIRGSNSPDSTWQQLCVCLTPPLAEITFDVGWETGSGYSAFSDTGLDGAPFTINNPIIASTGNPLPSLLGIRQNLNHDGFAYWTRTAVSIVFDTPQTVANVSFDIRMVSGFVEGLSSYDIRLDGVSFPQSTLTGLTTNWTSVSTSLTPTLVTRVDIVLTVVSGGSAEYRNIIDNVKIE